MRRIAITGMGTVNPIGENVANFWQALQEGRSGIDRLDWPELASGNHASVGGRVVLPKEKRHFFKNSKMLRRIDPYMIYSVIAGKEAVSSSALDIERESFRVGVVLGTGVGGLASHEKNQQLRLESGISAMHPMYVINGIPSTGVAILSQEIGAQGPSFSVNSACASSTHAIGIAKSLIEQGMADVIFAGGVEASLTPSGIAAFGNISALSISKDPQHASRPFDRERDGFILSDGCGIICLEELEHAKRRNAHIYAELKSAYFTSDAYDMVAPHPEATAAKKAIKAALKQAKINVEDIDLINAHATSTPLGDLAEGRAIEEVFGRVKNKVMVHSTKSMIGHTIAAAGCIEVIASVLALEQGIVHLSANLDNPDPAFSLNFVLETTKAPVRYVLSNSFGFGGHNAMLVLARWDGK